MTEREKFNALHRHEWELQGSAGVWESYYKCGKCGKWAREDGDGPALSADGCTQARATPQVPEGMVLVPLDALSRIMELAGVALVYQPFGTKDRQHFDALLAATKEKGE